MNKRYAFVRFPHYCHQHLKKKHSETPFVVVKESRRALFISDIGDDEKALGLHIGMPLAHARAIAPTLAHALHDDDETTRAFATIKTEALKFSPHIAAMDFGLLLNITGCAHLFGDEKTMLAAIAAHYQNFDLKTTIAIAPYPLLAQALAHFLPGTIATENIKALIKTLPIAALFVSQEIESILDDLAITTIGELMRLPRKNLAARLGIDFLHKLDQLLGVMYEPPKYLKEQPRFFYSDNFSSPIRDHAYLTQRCVHVLMRAIDDVKAHHGALGRVNIFLIDIFKKSTTITIEVSKPHTSLDAWCALLALKMENLRVDQGIDTIKLHVSNVAAHVTEQRNFIKQDERMHDDNDIAHVADQIKNKLGRDALFNLRIVEQHWPEHAITKDFSLAATKKSLPKLPPRPVRLLKTPWPISVLALLPDNPPAKIMWQNRSFTVANACGPERIEAAWWTLESDDEPRDYYAIEDDRGKRLWIYSTGLPKRWFIHGIFA